MGDKTGIRWTDTTENPIRVRNPETGKFGGFWCVKCSPGCTHCYAAREVARGRWGRPYPYIDSPNRPELYLEQSILDGWARKTKPKRRFVSSMTDIFAPFVPDEWQYAILDAQLRAPRQTFLNLTKRALEMLATFSSGWLPAPSTRPRPISGPASAPKTRNGLINAGERCDNSLKWATWSGSVPNRC